MGRWDDGTMQRFNSRYWLNRLNINELTARPKESPSNSPVRGRFEKCYELKMEGTPKLLTPDSLTPNQIKRATDSREFSSLLLISFEREWRVYS